MKNNNIIGYITMVFFIIGVISLNLFIRNVSNQSENTSYPETSIQLEGNTEEEVYEYLVDILPEDGSPVLIRQNKVGDNLLPEYHMTYAQLLPYKRNINDNRVYVYTVIIENN